MWIPYDEIREYGNSPEFVIDLFDPVNIIKYRPDQPRDEQGRWTRGGTSVCSESVINAKIADRMLNLFVQDKSAVYSFEEIEASLLSSPVGKDAAAYIEKNEYNITLIYDTKSSGYAGQIIGKEIIVYPYDNSDVTEVSSTIIHELCHSRYNWFGTQADEVNCRLMEVMHKNGDVQEYDIRSVVEFVRKEYSDLPEGDLYGF